MPSNKIQFIHVGFMRTGSSWLQKEFFPKLPLLFGNYHPVCNEIFYDNILKKSYLEYDPDHLKNP